MKFLSAVVASLLITVIFSAVMSFVFNRTLLNVDYLKAKADEVHLIEELKQKVPDMIASQSEGSAKEKAAQKAQVEKAIKSINLEGDINSYLSDLAKHYNAGGPNPELNLNDIAKQARSAGLEVPADVKPVSIPNQLDSQIKTVTATSQKTQTLSLVSAGILFLVLLLICLKEHSYGSMVYVCLMSALSFGVIAFLFKVEPTNFFKSFTPGDEAVQQFMPVIEKLVKSIAADLGQQFLWFTVGFGIATAVFAGFAIVSRTRRKSGVATK